MFLGAPYEDERKKDGLNGGISGCLLYIYPVAWCHDSAFLFAIWTITEDLYYRLVKRYSRNISLHVVCLSTLLKGSHSQRIGFNTTHVIHLVGLGLANKLVGFLNPKFVSRSCQYRFEETHILTTPKEQVSICSRLEWPKLRTMAGTVMPTSTNLPCANRLLLWFCSDACCLVLYILALLLPDSSRL